ncbi:MAG: peptidase C39 [Deltaproteobacteria bacterium]|nr:MAG: peptidase C39 [Deltaproteobacteria bacterium]
MNELVEFLGDVEVFSSFKYEELEYLAEHARSQRYKLGSTILNAGNQSKGLYVIRSGRVRLLAQNGGKEKSVSVQEAGDTFGEISVLKDQPMEYSVRASGKTEIIFFPREVVIKLLSENEAARNFMTRYVAFKVAGGFVTWLFDLPSKVSRTEIQEIIQSVGIRRTEAGQEIIAQDSAEDRSLYLIRYGNVRIVREEEGTVYDLTVLGMGQLFGEKACLLYSGQQAGAIAESDVVLIVVPQKTIHFILERNPNLRTVLEKRIQFLEKEIIRHRKLAERKNKGFLFDTRPKSEFGERIIRRFPIVEQAEEADCGAACLAMICKHYDISMTLGKLREMANVTTDGASMESLARVGESLGFATKGVRCTYNMMLGFDLPFIAHWEGYHYIVVYGTSKNHVWVADPGAGFRKLSPSEFEQGWTGNCLLLSPTENLTQTAEKRSPWSRFIGYLKPFKKILLDLFFAALIIQLLGLAPPVIIQNILDRVVAHQNHELLNVMILGLVIATIFSQITGFLSVYLLNFMIRKLDFNMISHFYKYVLSLPIDFFVRRKTGDIMARFHENNTIRRFMTEGSISTVLNTLMIFTYFTVMFIYNVRLTLLMLAFLPPIIILTLLATPKYKDYARKTFYASADAESLLVETLGGAEIVKGMGVERSMRLKWEKKYAKTLDLRYRAQMFTALIHTISGGLRAAATLTLLWAGAGMVLTQELTIGQLMAFNALFGSVMAPVMGLVGIWDELQETLVSMERLGDVLELEPEQKPEEISSRVVLPELKGDIRFENVYFRYGDKASPYILKDVNVEIKAGSTIAIVGRSGSGKTTFAKLLTGFYKPAEGKIYADGYDINMLDMEYFRKQIGYVMQSNSLFSGTVSGNIAIGDENPDKRRIADAAKLADAHGFISNMPMGYEQKVGERGMNLSGGQLQRICIARALYHNPGLLIFDEATSALDSESESHIRMNMNQILKGRTAIIIAHRLSTIMNVDKILVLYKGEIAEQGTHQELFEKKGMYFHLVQKQMEGLEN